MQDSQYNQIALPERLTIAEAPACYERLVAALVAGQPVSVDASQVTRVDAAGLQLLLGFARQAQQLSLPLQWQAITPSLQEAVDIAGLHDEIVFNLNKQEEHDQNIDGR
ncbi:anti-anti-sigma regulatory factor (antagonist of anti-sigma factor) [Methylophaga frappieri]|uniref:Anti-anti-sigma regulatory factor (Antagonist of anti-sigma factor) n=1 Tax=Methylophaga frappieri (strain ATCC BAA-2434 / DSM 25690 / JAM7) TaxID=754477 RepID=I1YKP3_METFJ|nr:STAS domain-containing protein [Methylophaga frappieri]AFJ03486.1 anti-anti-sigma regulatory factor (antagonist of anti-sigma factor) [Methylophaga frappieri]